MLIQRGPMIEIDFFQKLSANCFDLKNNEILFIVYKDPAHKSFFNLSWNCTIGLRKNCSKQYGWNTEKKNKTEKSKMNFKSN